MASIVLVHRRHLPLLFLIFLTLVKISQGGKRDSMEELHCGINNSPQQSTPIADGSSRIQMGRAAEPGEFPHQAKFEYSSGRQHCGGVIVDRQYILTAAHCAINETDTVEVGSHLVGNGTRYQIGKVLTHEEYLEKGLINDLALVKTTEPMEFVLTSEGEGSVNRVCLPDTSIEYTPGELGIVSGWGLDEQNDDFPGYLKQVTLALTSDEICNSYYHPFDASSHICAVGTVLGESVHIGDSGGPLVRLVDGFYQLVGTTSAMLPNQESPNLFCRVASFLQWIEHAKQVLDD